MRIKGLVLFGIMILVTLIYLFAGNFKGCTGTQVGNDKIMDTQAPAKGKKLVKPE